MRKEKSRGYPIVMYKNKNGKMIDKVSMMIGILICLIVCMLIGKIVWLIRCMILRVSACIKRGISGREGCQWLVGEEGSSRDLKEVIRDGLGIKGVSWLSWLSCLTNLTLAPGICVCPSTHADLTSFSNLLTSRGSLRLGYRLYKAKRLPSTGRTVRAIKSIKHIKGITF